MPAVHAILLAAGRSARLGRPKQLELLDGEPLLCRAVRTVLACDADRVHVVLGYKFDEIGRVLDGLNVNRVLNPEWEEGIASSIRAGLSAASEAGAVLISPCDLPYLNPGHLNALITAYEAGAPIAASQWAEVTGTPAIFDRRYFPTLLELQGDQGARPILRQEAALVQAIPFPAGAFDIDEPADVENLRLNPPQS